MIRDTMQPNLPQPFLFSFEQSSGNLELFPAVWGAIEDLIKPDPVLRCGALDRLESLNAPRLSPIVAYILATRLMDPDIETRARVIQVIGEILSPDENGLPAPEEVRSVLLSYLSQLRTRNIFALLQISEREHELLRCVSRILDACPYAGTHLTNILSDIHAPMEIRRQAVVLIGQVGFLDALPALERIENRLEARLNGQKSMPFAPTTNSNENVLLPAIRETLNLLRAP